MGTFGRPHAEPKRVRRILKALGMHKTWVLVEDEFRKNGRIAELGTNVGSWNQNGKQVGEEEEEDSADGSRDGESEFDGDGFEAGRWQESLSYAELAKIHFARALIVNPEVLVMHKPFSHYDFGTAENVMQVLKAHVRNRGFKVPSAGVGRRRPRTCFFTPSTEQQAQQADVIWAIEGSGTVRQWSKEMLQEN